MSKMTDKLTPNTMKTQYDHQWNVFCKKNHDYGNSFEKSLDTFGLVAGIVRMNDKFERLVSLNDPSKDAQIASESLVDTLEDLSNYAAMAACWLKRKKERNWVKERLTAIKKEAKKENDRVMLDMMLSRIEKGEVVRIVANGDGSFTTYFEKTDGPFDKIVDKEDESIYHEREGWEEEVKLEGQNGSSVTFTDDNGIFSFGKGVTARSLGDITLTAGPGKPKEKKKTLNDIRKEHGFDPVNGEEDDR
ncbi:MAG: nucleotide modification associated domain-containing protein [Veillonella parvula]